MFRNRILLASLLKPVTDTRIYEKMGKSLLQLPHTEVHIIGYAAPLPTTTEERLFLHPLFKFKRLSWRRFTSQWTYWKSLLKIKPTLLIVGTHELLLISWLFSLKSGCKLIYDVRENYALNLSTQNIYKNGLGSLMAKVVRFIEKGTASRIQHFFLAEEAYSQELSFIDNKYSILPNKYLPSGFLQPKKPLPLRLEPEKTLRLLYSGTISRIYGTLEAVTFTEQLREFIPQAELVIIGYCAEKEYLEELRERISNLPFVKLIGGNHLVPHAQILEMQYQCHIGLLPYQPHPSTFSCIPTKLYEYLANSLIVIVQQNPRWEEILKETDGGISFNFSERVNSNFIHQLFSRSFYKQGTPKGILWQEEEPHLLSVVQNLL